MPWCSLSEKSLSWASPLQMTPSLACPNVLADCHATPGITVRRGGSRECKGQPQAGGAGRRIRLGTLGHAPQQAGASDGGARGEEETPWEGGESSSQTLCQRKMSLFPSSSRNGRRSPASAAVGAASCRAGERGCGRGLSSSGSAGAPRASGPCPGWERRGCGCSPGQRALPPRPPPAPGGAAPAAQGRAQVGASRDPRGGRPAMSMAVPLHRSPQSCWKSPRGGQECPPGRPWGWGWLQAPRPARRQRTAPAAPGAGRSRCRTGAQRRWWASRWMSVCVLGGGPAAPTPTPRPAHTGTGTAQWCPPPQPPATTVPGRAPVAPTAEGSWGCLGGSWKSPPRPQERSRPPEHQPPAPQPPAHPGGLQPGVLWHLGFGTSNNPPDCPAPPRARWPLSATCRGGSLASAMPSAAHSLSRIGGGKVTCRRCPLHGRGRWGSSTRSQQPCSLHAVVGWRALRTRSCSLSLAPQLWVSNAAKGREATVTRRPADGRKTCLFPSRRTPSPLPEPQRPPHDRPTGTFPCMLTCAAASAPRSARLPGAGRAGETQAMAPGRAARAADGSPRSTTQHQEKSPPSRPRRHARPESWARLGQALPSPKDNQRGTWGPTLWLARVTLQCSVTSPSTPRWHHSGISPPADPQHWLKLGRLGWRWRATFPPWGQSGSGAGWLQRLCRVCAWSVSSPSRKKPWAPRSDPTAHPALGLPEASVIPWGDCHFCHPLSACS